MQEDQVRSIVKTLGYRAIVVIQIFMTTYFFTGNISQSTKLTLVSNLFGIVIYYLWERLWIKINWRRIN
jgi:uncharacterized membrane protein